MKKIFGLTFGGLRHKILTLVIAFLLALLGVAVAASFYGSKTLTAVVEDTRVQQQDAIESISSSTVHQIIAASMVNSTELNAETADDMFVEVTDNIKVLQAVAQGLFRRKNTLEAAPFSLPDPASDGTVTTQVLFEEGVDYTRSEYLGIAAHMNDLLKAMTISNEKIGVCYIGLEDGTFFGTDKIASDKFDENGRQISFPVRERPWYRGAADNGDIFFTGIEKDAYNGSSVITCSAPVTINGKLYGVVGIDIFLNNLEEFTNNSVNGASFLCIINDSGQIVFAPRNNGIFEIKPSDLAIDLRQSSNAELSALVTQALKETTEMMTININGKEYYASGSPMETIGWAVISVVDKEVTEQSTVQMLNEYDRINKMASYDFQKGTEKMTNSTIFMLALIFVLASCTALLVAGRIVDPVQTMTSDIIEGATTGKLFEMKPVYKTNDEIQVLAEAFDDLSKKTKQYIIDITRITKEKERISTELELARLIQADMLPNIYPAFPERSDFDICATMTPAKEVGGDFYDFFLVDDDHLCMVMADVSGKGVPAALVMMVSKILINNYAMAERSPKIVLEKLNQLFCANNKEDMFVTVWLGIMEISTGTIVAANAGHEYPIVKRPGGKYELIKDKHGFVVGGLEGIKYTEYTMKLERGSVLFLYTDGAPEATNGESEMYGTDRLLEALDSTTTNNPKELLTGIKAAVDAFVGPAEQFDDLTMLAMMLK